MASGNQTESKTALTWAVKTQEPTVHVGPRGRAGELGRRGHPKREGEGAAMHEEAVPGRGRCGPVPGPRLGTQPPAWVPG